MDVHSMLMTYRPMAQLLQLFVIPEVEARIAAGKIAADTLPLQLHQFRFLQGDGKSMPRRSLVSCLSVRRMTTC